jgi:beta-mannanase
MYRALNRGLFLGFACLVGLLTLTSLAGASGATAAPVVLGATTTGITEDTGAALEAFAARSGVTPKIAMYYQDWNEGWSTALLNPRFVAPIVARGAMPMITWEPFLDSGEPTNQPQYSPARIAAGDFDPYIRRAAREAAAYGQPFLLRFAHEMNGTWYQWGAIPGNSPEAFVAMWRHVVSIFREEGALNVRWVWAPNVYSPGSAARPFAPYYPGDEWVDYVALDGYNWGTAGPSGWKSFAQVFGPSYAALTALTSKPMMISETASSSSGGDKAAWIREILTVLPTQMPRVRALVWFDREKETDWQIDSDPASALAFRELAASRLFSGTLAELLNPVPEKPAPAPAPSPELPVLQVEDPATAPAASLVFPVTSSAAPSKPIRVHYVFEGKGARHVRKRHGIVVIVPGSRSTAVKVGVRHDPGTGARTEQVWLKLFRPRGARLGRNVARGTIRLSTHRLSGQPGT